MYICKCTDFIKYIMNVSRYLRIWQKWLLWKEELDHWEPEREKHFTQIFFNINTMNNLKGKYKYQENTYDKKCPKA